VLKKHKIPFYVDIDTQRQTLERLKTTDYKIYVPSHGEPFSDIQQMVDLNVEIILYVENFILDNLHGRQSTDDIIRMLCDGFNIRLTTLQQYYLIKTITMAYLSYLHRKGKVSAIVNENYLVWKLI